MLDLDTLLESDGLFQTVFPSGIQFCYRLLTLKEYRVFRGLRDGGVWDPMVVASKVFERCYVGNAKHLDQDLPAGIEISLGNLIMYLSGDCEMETLKHDLHLARQAYPRDSVAEYMKRIVCTAFQAYRWEELDGWTRSDLIRKFVISEAILQNRLGDQYKPLDIKEIKSADELNAKPAHDINFQKENAMIRKSMGPWAEEEARETSKLSREQLQKVAKQRG